MCSTLLHLAPGSRDLSQAEKRVTCYEIWANSIQNCPEWIKLSGVPGPWVEGEHWTCNPRVSGSIPIAGNLKKLLIWMKIIIEMHGWDDNACLGVRNTSSIGAWHNSLDLRPPWYCILSPLLQRKRKKRMKLSFWVEIVVILRICSALHNSNSHLSLR
jgi:hypothetical protein